MNEAIERLRKSRQTEIKVGGVTFTCQRFTNEQFGVYHDENITTSEICRRHVTGWAGVTERDVYGEGDKSVPFDRELFNEVIGNRTDWAQEIVKKMLVENADFQKKCSEEIKK